MNRIELSDSILDMVFKMSGGNPGAATVLSQMMREASYIDPDNLLGGVGPILHMDALGIYESRIWMLYKDVCKENLSHTLAMLRAVQLGILAESTFDHAIDNYGFGVDVSEVVTKVRERLPAFNAIP